MPLRATALTDSLSPMQRTLSLERRDSLHQDGRRPEDRTLHIYWHQRRESPRRMDERFQEETIGYRLNMCRYELVGVVAVYQQLDELLQCE